MKLIIISKDEFRQNEHLGASFFNRSYFNSRSITIPMHLGLFLDNFVTNTYYDLFIKNNMYNTLIKATILFCKPSVSSNSIVGVHFNDIQNDVLENELSRIYQSLETEFCFFNYNCDRMERIITAYRSPLVSSLPIQFAFK